MAAEPTRNHQHHDGPVRMRKRFIGFLFIATVAVVVHYSSFKMRYGWYTSDEEAAFLNTGFAALLVVIVSLWVLHPTRIGVGLAGAAAVVFPWALRPEDFPALDPAYAALSLIPIALLVFATHLRLRTRTISQANSW